MPAVAVGFERHGRRPSTIEGSPPHQPTRGRPPRRPVQQRDCQAEILSKHPLQRPRPHRAGYWQAQALQTDRVALRENRAEFCRFHLPRLHFYPGKIRPHGLEQISARKPLWLRLAEHVETYRTGVFLFTTSHFVVLCEESFLCLPTARRPAPSLE